MLDCLSNDQTHLGQVGSSSQPCPPPSTRPRARHLKTGQWQKAEYTLSTELPEASAEERHPARDPDCVSRKKKRGVVSDLKMYEEERERERKGVRKKEKEKGESGISRRHSNIVRGSSSSGRTRCVSPCLCMGWVLKTPAWWLSRTLQVPKIYRQTASAAPSRAVKNMYVTLGACLSIRCMFV
jgi:hypothetical protein